MFKEKRQRVKWSYSHWLYFAQREKNKITGSNTRQGAFLKAGCSKVLCTRGDFWQLLEVPFFCPQIYLASFFHNIVEDCAS